jgi:hypothetical protein
MNEIALLGQVIGRMSECAIDTVRKLEEFSLKNAQTKMLTRHVFHAGIYSRTITIPAGVWLTGAYIIVPTLLIVSGHALVFCGETWIEIDGYRVVPASAGRKQAFVAIADTDLTMNFATSATTVEEAENEFTNEAERLMSRHADAENFVIITGE